MSVIHKNISIRDTASFGVKLICHPWFTEDTKNYINFFRVDISFLILYIANESNTYNKDTLSTEKCRNICFEYVDLKSI